MKTMSHLKWALGTSCLASAARHCTMSSHILGEKRLPDLGVYDFEKGSDIWVVSLRLFGTDTPFHGIVDNYELSGNGKVLYEIHFDDGDIEIDVGDEGDQLYHEEPERESERNIN